MIDRGERLALGACWVAHFSWSGEGEGELGWVGLLESEISLRTYRSQCGDVKLQRVHVNLRFSCKLMTMLIGK